MVVAWQVAHRGGGLLVARIIADFLRGNAERQARFTGLLGLAADAYWEVDDQHRFIGMWRVDAQRRFVPVDVPRAYDALVYAYLQLGQDANALAALREAEKPGKVVGPLAAAQVVRAAAQARYLLERQAWKAAAELDMSEGDAVAETLTRFARALGAARSGGVAAALTEIDKLRAVRAAFDGAHQVYWTGQTELLILAAQAWVAQAQGHRPEAHKLMRAAADLEDGSAKHALLENRLYPMRELLADLLREQGDPGAALTEYDAALKTTPNRLRSYYGAARAAEAIGERKKAAAYFAQLAKLTQEADGNRPELIELKAKTP